MSGTSLHLGSGTTHLNMGPSVSQVPQNALLKVTGAGPFCAQNCAVHLQTGDGCPGNPGLVGGLCLSFRFSVPLSSPLGL